MLNDFPNFLGEFQMALAHKMGVDTPMSSALSLEPLGGGLTPLKYAQMFVVGAAVALGGALTG